MGTPPLPDSLGPELLAKDLKQARAAHDELDKRIFQLNILYQSAKELADMGNPRELALAFLLNSMGGVGTGMGFLAIKAPSWEKTRVIARGLTQETLAALEKGLANASFPIPDDAPPHMAQVLMRDPPGADMNYPRNTAIVFGWKGESGLAGLVGLGPRLSGQPYDAESTDFLQNLLHTFSQALGNAIAGETITALNHNLLEKNAQLESALKQAREAQAHLDRRIFHLHTLYDTNLELSMLQDSKSMLDTFTLLLQGAFSLEGVCALLYEQNTEELLQTIRGDVEVPHPYSQAQAKTLLYKCISASSFERLQPQSAQFLPIETFSPGDQPCFFIQRALLFRVDSGCLGLLFLGAKHTREEFSKEEDSVLLTLVHNFLVFLEKARSFQTIQNLNQDLNTRNTELQHTLDELTASRGRIEVLERAGVRLRAMLHRESERIGRVTKWDFVWLIASCLILGLLFNASNPTGVDIIPEVLRTRQPPVVSGEQAKALVDKGAVLVDARPASFYEQGHAQGSVNMPPTLFDFIYTMRFGDMDLEAPIVIYGRTISRLYDAEVALRLKAQGHGNLLLLEEWEAGLPQAFEN